ncbi:GspH/FimT family pseudopilin [Thermus thalpophilus]|uniref:GspH/FimT family pseudopilin n=1 Tax=Thermus thalpophilus TaxID=2908147 RepID=UPI001FAA7A12|nr:GspH/FimT family protein [Thermus thalpophilus]
MRTPSGLALIELVIVVAILGILFALGTGYLRSDRIAVNQAAQTLAAQVTRARLEAIRRNAFVGLAFNAAGAGSYRLFVDENRNGSYDGGETVIQSVTFGQGDWGRVRLQSVSGASTLVFDPRGIPHDLNATSVTLSNWAGTYSKQVQVTPQGRASVQ